MRELTPPQADDLYELISERTASSSSMILTSNRKPSDWYPLFPQPRRGRVTARPTHQQQPPDLHERSKLPTQQQTRACRPHVHQQHLTASTNARTWGIT
ncbi:hypothetical protein [Actinopolymorpha alba]|uniref:hypothetical protein n=1 Tax=Actinopolymorpha alba TaxID=533267 RepID=UPI003B505C85